MAWILGALVGIIAALVFSGSYPYERRLNALLSILFGAAGGVLGIWFFFGVLGIITASAIGNFLLGILWAVVGSAVVLGVVYWLTSYSYREEYPERREMRGTAHEYDEEEHITRRRRK